MIYCKKCGRPNEDHYRFCLGCGARLEHQKASSPAPKSPSPAEIKPKTQPEPAKSTSLASLSRPMNVGSKPAPESKPAPAPKPAPEPAPPAVEERICTNCGAQVAPGNAFCGKCGTPYKGPTSSKTAMHHPVTPKAELVLIQADGSSGARLPLHNGERVVGRDDDTFKADPFISPVHARFKVDDQGAITVYDEKSLNGVFVRLDAPIPLQHGDTFRVGLELLRYHDAASMAWQPSEDTDATAPQASLPVKNWGRLERIISPEASSHAYMLTGEEISIGRDVGDILFSNDAFVSGRHAAIKLQGDKVVLEDLGSSNGTFIRLREPRQLKHGDTLLIGQQLMMIHIVER